MDCSGGNQAVGGIGADGIRHGNRQIGNFGRDGQHGECTRRDGQPQELEGADTGVEPAFRHEHGDFPQADIATIEIPAGMRPLDEAARPARQARRFEGIEHERVRVKDDHARLSTRHRAAR